MENYNNIDKRSYVTYYYLNDKLHRLHKPAVEWNDSTKEWWQNDLLHRIGGPAVEDIDGYKEWWKNGLRHRLDGHAIEYPNRNKVWCYEGEYITCDSQKEFERMIKLKLFW
jgi:hypothetical protein